MIDCIPPRAKISPSLPKHFEAIATLYILWKVSGMPYELEFGEEYIHGTNTLYKFTSDEVDKIKSYLGEDCVITDAQIQSNTLLETQMEPIQTGALNCFNVGNLEFTSGQSSSSERKGGNRYKKTILYTSVIDLFDAYVLESEAEFKFFVCELFSGKSEFSNNYDFRLGRFWSFFINQTLFKDASDGIHYLATDCLSSGFSFNDKGPARIVKSFIKAGSHYQITQGFTAKNPSEITNYSKRLKFWNSIFHPHYCSEGNEGDDVSAGSQDNDIDAEHDLSVNVSDSISITASIPKNILFKGVPGTGKSRAVNKILTQYFDLGNELRDLNNDLIPRVLRINIHSGTTNATLMQGIGVQTKEEKIIYSEKKGLILNFLFQAIQNPKVPFALILEEIQENSLNILIGDLIYLIEESKRTDVSKLVGIDAVSGKDIFGLVDSIYSLDASIDYVTIPSLIKDDVHKDKKLIFPSNLYVFCTSNYRDDKKVLEDNLLRRFEVIEIYPNSAAIVDEDVQRFFHGLNNSIIEYIDETHSDRFLIGHANWINVNSAISFNRALLRVVVDFKEIKDFEFETTKEILESVVSDIPFSVSYDFNKVGNYSELVQLIQNECDYDFL